MIAQTKSTVEWRKQEIQQTWSPLQRERRAADGQRRRDWFVAQFADEQRDRRAVVFKLLERPAKCG